MKKQHWAFPEFPKNAVRITNAEGNRVWRFPDGREYESKRSYFEAMQAAAIEARLKLDAAEGATRSHP